MCLGWSLELDSYIGLCHMSADFSKKREREREKLSDVQLSTLRHGACSTEYVVCDF